YAGEAARERGVVQLPGVDSPSRLYATPGAADVG
ncbi:GNAT family N-acetyltransferase, partial [Stenotrophomonas pavanii]